MYNRPLSESEVRSIARAGQNGKVVGTVGFSRQSAAPGPVQVGQAFSYGYAITNHAGIPLSGLLLRQPVPSGWTLMRAESPRGSVTVVDGVVRWEPGILNPEQNAQLNLTVVPDAVGADQLVATLYGGPGNPISDVAQFEAVVVPEVSANTPGLIGIPVERPNAVDLEVSLTPAWQAPIQVDYALLSDTAIGGVDFDEARGTLEFQPGETKQFIPLRLLPHSPISGDLALRLELSNPRGAVIKLAMMRILLRGDRTEMTLGTSDDGKPAFRIHMIAGRRYELQRTTSLKDPEWTFVGDAYVNQGEGDTLFSDPLAGDQPFLFYRVVVSQR